MYRPVQQSSTPPPATAAYGEYFHDSGHATTTTTQLHPADAAQNPLLNEGFEYKSARVASPVSISTTDDGGRKKKKKKASRVGWRPFTIKPPFILFFALVTVGLLCALEYILQRSKRDGALLFSESSYLLDYGPMVVAVLFGLLWASIDHDVKRYLSRRIFLPDVPAFSVCRMSCDPGRGFISHTQSNLKLPLSDLSIVGWVWRLAHRHGTRGVATIAPLE